MRPERVMAVESPGRRASGYVISARLVLTSAHATPDVGRQVSVFALGEADTWSGRVVWRGEPGGRTDAALVEVDDPGWRPPGGVATRWGRVVTNRPGIECQAWGFPQWVQREGRAVEAWQPSGTLNPGNRYVGDLYVLSLSGQPPAPLQAGGSPWAGLSGAALFCSDLLAGVVAGDPAGGQHGHLEAMPAYALAQDGAFRQVLAEHGMDDLMLEPVELQDLAQAEPPLAGSPAALLRARRQVVGFRGRQQQLEELLAWCQRPGSAAWLLHGSAGQGKTRLGQELARRLGEQRWAWLWLRPDAPAEALSVLGEAAVPLLVIVDYAETRPDQLTRLLRAIARHDGDMPLRLLLLARSAGEWWNALQASDPHAEAILDGSRVSVLTELEPERAGRATAYRQAVTDLSRALAGLPGYAHQDWPGVAERVSADVAGLDQPASALTLQMTALANLLDAAAPSCAAARPVAVEDRLLSHERRYWHSTAAAHRLYPALSEDTLLDVLAAAMLLGAGSREDAAVLLKQLPALVDQTRDRRKAVQDWITQLYPPTDARPWGSLQPDRLAERFVGTRLEATPDLVDPLLATATPAQLAQLLTVYARAARHPAFGGRLHTQLTELCVRYADHLALPAIDVATQVETPGPLIDALQQFSLDADLTLDELSELYDRLPHASHNLAEFAAVLCQRLVDEHRRLATDHPDPFLHDLANSLDTLSYWLRQLGRRDAALAASGESVAAYRQLVLAWPNLFLPDLAGSLNTLSIHLGELGRYEDGLDAIQESVTILRQLVAAHPDRYLPDLAVSLNTLSVRLGELRRKEDGLAAIEEAVAAYRQLVAADPDTFLLSLAASLNNLSIRLGELGRQEDGLEAIQESVTIRRQLAAAHPDAFLPDLPTSLNNLSVRLADLGRHEEALAASAEAVTVCRQLAAARLDAFLPALATSLNNLSVDLGELGRHEEGLEAIQESVTICRQLAAAYPDAFLRDLYGSLNNLSSGLAAVGRREDALAVVEEAGAVYWQLLIRLHENAESARSARARPGRRSAGE